MTDLSSDDPFSLVLHSYSIDSENENNESQKFSLSNDISKVFDNDTPKSTNILTYELNDASPSNIPIIFLRNCINFTSKIYELVNSGSFHELRDLIDVCAHKDCVLTWQRSVFKHYKIGSNYLTDYFISYLSTSPDAIILARSIKQHSVLDNHIVIKCNINESFTPMYNYYLQRFYGDNRLYFDFISKDEIMKLPNHKQLLKVYEKYLSSQFVHIQIFNKIVVLLYFDRRSYLLVKYEEIVQLKSFKIINDNVNYNTISKEDS